MTRKGKKFDPLPLGGLSITPSILFRRQVLHDNPQRWQHRKLGAGRRWQYCKLGAGRWRVVPVLCGFFVTFCNIFYVRGCMYLLRKLVPSWFRSSLATFFTPKSPFFFTRVFPERRVRRGHFVNVLKSKKISFLEKTHRHCQSIN
jgi:hypothetical protein